MATIQQILNGDSGLVARNKINGNANNLNAGKIEKFSVNALGTNPSSWNVESGCFARATMTLNTNATLTFSNVSNLDDFSIQITNTNANVLTFAGVTVYFKAADLPDGVTFAANALTFPADSAVVYNLVAVAFDGSTFDCKIEIR